MIHQTKWHVSNNLWRACANCSLGWRRNLLCLPAAAAKTLKGSKSGLRNVFRDSTVVIHCYFSYCHLPDSLNYSSHFPSNPLINKAIPPASPETAAHLMLLFIYLDSNSRDCGVRDNPRRSAVYLEIYLVAWSLGFRKSGIQNPILSTKWQC